MTAIRNDAGLGMLIRNGAVQRRPDHCPAYFAAFESETVEKSESRARLALSPMSAKTIEQEKS